MSRPFSPRSTAPSASFARVNGKIRAREVRVIGIEGHQYGVLPLGEAINLARANGVDLVEIAANATPPVCRLVDFGKYRYEQAKKDKEAKKHQHANKVKEIQLSPKIDPHDLGIKLGHAIDFLCEEMKVKVTLKFRGREMAHKEYGFLVINKFLKDIEPYGHPDFAPKLIGKGINVMISPLPKNKRAKNPRGESPSEEQPSEPQSEAAPEKKSKTPAEGSNNAHHVATDAAETPASFGQNPFAQIDAKLSQS